MKELIENPLYDVIKILTGKEPPNFVKGKTSTAELNDEEFLTLQDFCSENAVLNWLTGIGILEAADVLVEESINNGNIVVVEG